MNTHLDNLVKNVELSINRYNDIIDALDSLHIHGYKDCKTYSNVCEAILNLRDVMQQVLSDFKANQKEDTGGDANGNDN